MTQTAPDEARFLRALIIHSWSGRSRDAAVNWIDAKARNALNPRDLRSTRC
jgi:hypothetical protein